MPLPTLTKEERLYIVREYMGTYGDSLTEACERFDHELGLMFQAEVQQTEAEGVECGTCVPHTGQCYCSCHAD